LSTTTSNYKFVKPELTDGADITATNVNWDILDENLGTGDGITTMTYAEWLEWRESDEYDPEMVIGITDDYAQAPYTIKEVTLLASGWIGDSAPYYYDFATPYPSAVFDIETIPLATYTEEQRKAIMNAYLVGADDNNLYVWGEKPDVDIPIKVKVVAK
jgi:hypothetical protein